MILNKRVLLFYLIKKDVTFFRSLHICISNKSLYLKSYDITMSITISNKLRYWQYIFSSKKTRQGIKIRGLFEAFFSKNWKLEFTQIAIKTYLKRFHSLKICTSRMKSDYYCYTTALDKGCAQVLRRFTSCLRRLGGLSQ